MKKSARIALHCLLAMVLTVPLAACGSDTKDTTPKKDMSANTREQLAELAKSDERLTGELENKTIKWMSDWDINSDDTGKTTPIELAVFQERYGGQIEWYQTTYGSRYDNLANAINSDEGVDFFYGGNWDAFPKGAVRGMFVPYDNYIDLDSELWADVKDANDAMMWNGGHYMAIVEVTGDNCAIIYNRKTMDENGLDDPAELFEKGKWDWDAFEDMLSEFVDTSDEHYGIDSWYFESGLSASTGVPYIGLENGKLVNNLRNEAIEDYQNWMYGLWQSDYIALGVGDYGWTSRDYSSARASCCSIPAVCGRWAMKNPSGPRHSAKMYSLFLSPSMTRRTSTIFPPASTHTALSKAVTIRRAWASSWTASGSARSATAHRRSAMNSSSRTMSGQMK